MKIYSFFSFKGGVGRTALLTNIGAQWADQGRTVLLVDMDLAAPGLSYSPLLGDWLDPRGVDRGFSDFMHAYHQGKVKDPENLYIWPPEQLIREVHCPENRPWHGGGRLLAIDAGIAQLPRLNLAEKGTRRTVDSLDEAEGNERVKPVFQSTLPGMIPPEYGWEDENREEFSLRALALVFKRALQNWRPPGVDKKDENGGIDAVLIDCRTGFPELLELSLGYLSDRMVMVTGLNEQNRHGLKYMLKRLQARIAPGAFPETLRLVVSPVPRNDDELVVLKALKVIENDVASLMRLEENNDIPESTPSRSLIHYTPLLATGDTPLVTRLPHLLYSQEVREVARWLDADYRTESLQESIKDRIGETGDFLKRSQPEKKFSTEPTHHRRNPLYGLPRWYWPLPEDRKNEKDRLAKLRELIGFEITDPMGVDTFLTKLSWSVSLDAENKQKILRGFKTLTQIKMDELSKIFEEERQRFAALESEQWPGLVSLYMEHQETWARLVRGEGGVAHFYTAPLEGISLHRAWESWADYWLILAEKQLTDLKNPHRAEQALAKALALDNGADVIHRAAELIPGGEAMPDLTARMIRTLSTAAGENTEAHFALGVQLQTRLYDESAALPVYERALELARQTGDKQTEAQVSGNLSIIHLKRGDLAPAQELCEQALALNRELGRKAGMANQYGNLGLIHRKRGDLDRAQELFEQSLALNRELGRKEGMAIQYGNHGLINRKRGDLDRAQELHEQALDLNRELGLKEGMANEYDNLGEIHLEKDETERAAALFEQSLNLFQEIGNKEGIALLHGQQGRVFLQTQLPDRAQTCFEQALAQFQKLGVKEGMASQQGYLGRVNLQRGQLQEAEDRFNQALTLFREIGAKLEEAEQLANLGDLHQQRNDHSTATECWQQALAIYKKAGAKLRIAELERKLAE